jgi:hypothetical protein
MRISRRSPIASSPSSRTEVGSQLWAKEQGKLTGPRRKMLSDLWAPEPRAGKRSRKGKRWLEGASPALLAKLGDR